MSKAIFQDRNALPDPPTYTPPLTDREKDHLDRSLEALGLLLELSKEEHPSPAHEQDIINQAVRILRGK